MSTAKIVEVIAEVGLFLTMCGMWVVLLLDNQQISRQLDEIRKLLEEKK